MLRENIGEKNEIYYSVNGKCNALENVGLTENAVDSAFVEFYERIYKSDL